MQIILADNQAIFCAGIARVLMTEPAMRVADQCTDLEGLQEAVSRLRRSIVIFPSSITGDLHSLIDFIHLAGSRSVMILEQDASLHDSVARRLEGVILRSVAAPQLVHCLYRISAGERYVQRAV